MGREFSIKRQPSGQKSGPLAGQASGDLAGQVTEQKPGHVERPFSGADFALFSEMSDAELQAVTRDICPRACRELWGLVVLGQWQTALEPVRKDTTAEIAAARRWFGSPDFLTACNLSGVDPKCVLDAFRARLREVEERERRGDVLRDAVSNRGMSREEIRAVCAARRRSVAAVLAAGPKPSTGTLAHMFGVSHAVMLQDLREIQRGNVE